MAPSERLAANVGGNVIWVIALCARLLCNDSIFCVLPGTCSAAPRHSAIIISQIQASKLKEANWRIRLLDSTPNFSICAETRLQTPRCSTKTPLGIPLEPEV